MAKWLNAISATTGQRNGERSASSRIAEAAIASDRSGRTSGPPMRKWAARSRRYQSAGCPSPCNPASIAMVLSPFRAIENALTSSRDKAWCQARKTTINSQRANIPTLSRRLSAAVAGSHSSTFVFISFLAVGAWPPGIDKRQRGNNGTQAVTDSYARRYGLNSRDTVYSSLKILKERGLIVQTREGWRNKSHFSLYAVGWLPITHRDGKPLDSPEPAPNGWRTWQPALKEEKHSVRLSDVPCPENGQDHSICRPIDPSRQSLCSPTIGNTLRPVSYTHLRAHETGRNLV